MFLFHALAWEASEKSSYKEQTSLSICWGVERGRQRDEKEKIPITEVVCFFGCHTDIFAGSIQDNCISNVLQKSKYFVFICVFLRI